MKKMLSLLLVLLFVLVPVVSLTGCGTKKEAEKQDSGISAVELFKKGEEKLSEFFAGQPLVDEAFWSEANKYSGNLSDFSIEVSEDISGEAFSIPNLFFSVVTGDGAAVADIRIGDEGEGIAAKLEVQNGKDVFLSVPDATDKYLSADLDDIKNLIAEGGDIGDGSAGGALGVSDGLVTFLKESLDTYMTDSYIKSETVDVTVMGEEVKNAVKATLTIPQEETAKLLNSILEMIDEEAMPEEELKCTVSVSYTFAGDELRAAEAVIDEEGKTALGCTAGFKKADDTATAELQVYLRDGEESILGIPVKYSCKDTGASVEGSFSMKCDLTRFEEYMEESADDTADTGTYSFESEPDEVSDQLDNAFSKIDIAVEWNGTRVDDVCDYEYKIKLADPDAGMEIEFPFTVHTEQTETTDLVSVNIDAKFMGMFGIKAKFEITAEKGATLAPGSYSPSDAIELSDILSGSSAAQNKLDSLTSDFFVYFMTNPGAARVISELEWIGELAGEMEYPDDTDPMDTDVVFTDYEDTETFGTESSTETSDDFRDTSDFIDTDSSGDTVDPSEDFLLGDPVFTVSDNKLNAVAYFTDTNTGYTEVGYDVEMSNDGKSMDLTGDFESIRIVLAENDVAYVDGEKYEYYEYTTSGVKCYGIASPDGSTLILVNTDPDEDDPAYIRMNFRYEMRGDKIVIEEFSGEESVFEYEINGNIITIDGVEYKYNSIKN